jgi:hypothetical protein
MEPSHIFVHLHLYCVPQLHPHFHKDKREVIRKKKEKKEEKTGCYRQFTIFDVQTKLFYRMFLK